MLNLKTKNLERAARMLRTVAHPVRIKMIDLLETQKTLSVNALKTHLGITQSMTSQHLAALKNIGVVACQKQGNVCHYHLCNKHVLKLLTCVKRCALDDVR